MQSPVDSIEKTVAGSESSISPKSILRRSTAPSHWPLSLLPSNGDRRSVHFPPPPSIVTATHTRPRTHILDRRDLYYSDQDIKKFKREYKSEKTGVNAGDEHDHDRYGYLDGAITYDTSFLSTKEAMQQFGSPTSFVVELDEEPTSEMKSDNIDGGTPEPISTERIQSLSYVAREVLSRLKDQTAPPLCLYDATNQEYNISTKETTPTVEKSTLVPRRHYAHMESSASLYLVDTMYLY